LRHEPNLAIGIDYKLALCLIPQQK